MKNLFALLYKNHLFLLFLLLEIIALSIAIQHNVFQKSTFISSASSVAGGTYEKLDDFIGYMNLKEKNALLADSLAKVKSQTLSALYLRDTSHQKINDTLHKQHYTFLAARVVHLTTHKPNNFLTIDKGSDDGVAIDMAVVGINGIVGKVNGVTANYASVMSILHSKAELGCRFKRTNNVGFLHWNNIDYDARTILLTDVPLTAKVSKGDTVETTNFSNSYPAGIPVGRVLNFALSERGQSQDVTVELFLDFNVLQHVFVVKDLMKEQRDSIAIKFQHD